MFSRFCTNVLVIQSLFVVIIVHRGRLPLLVEGMELQEDKVDDACNSCYGDEDKPEPEEEEDDLIPEVHRKWTHDRVAVCYPHLQDLKIAQYGCWKNIRRLPRSSRKQLPHYRKSVWPSLIFTSQKAVQQTQLSQDVSNVPQSDRDVDDEGPVTAEQKPKPFAGRREFPSSTELDKMSAEARDHVLHVLCSPIWTWTVLSAQSLGENYVSYVDWSRNAWCEIPEQLRQIGEKSLEHEEKRNPLVVTCWELISLSRNKTVQWFYETTRRPTSLHKKVNTTINCSENHRKFFLRSLPNFIGMECKA